MESTYDTLLAAAHAARRMAHAPYSGFAVGAALRSGDGTVHAGANIENAAYPEGICAETAAIAAMVLAGGRMIEEILVLADGPAACSPCGGCRQRIREFAGPGTLVHMTSLAGARHTVTLGELLPYAFGPEVLT